MSESKRVFVSGSMGVKVLPRAAQDSLSKIIELGLVVLVGDAPGVDTKVQVFLASKGYSNVVVFGCSQYGLRFGHPDAKRLGWKKRIVKGGPSGKDAVMTNEAKYALAIWDGSSRGTRSNISRCESKGVQCKVIPAQSIPEE